MTEVVIIVTIIIIIIIIIMIIIIIIIIIGGIRTRIRKIIKGGCVFLSLSVIIVVDRITVKR